MKNVAVSCSLLAGIAFPMLARAQVDPAPNQQPVDTESTNASYRIEGDDVVLDFTARDSVSLEALTELCSKVTGYAFEFNERDLADRGMRRVGTQRVPKAKFFSFYQDVLRRSELALLPNRASQGKGITPSYSLRSTLGGNGRPGAMKTEAPFIPASELESHRFDSALLFTTSIQLAHANAQDATNSLQVYFTDPMLESVRAVATSNAVLLTGFGSNLAQVADLVRMIDVEPQPVDRKSIVIPLHHALASDVAGIVEDQFRGVLRAPQPTPIPESPSLGVTANSLSNSLVVTGTRDAIAFAEALTKQLDVAPEDPLDTAVVAMKNAAAQEIAVTLNAFFVEKSHTVIGKEKDGDPIYAPSESRVFIVPDSRTNSLVVRAPKSRHEAILGLIQALDRPSAK